MCIRDRLDIAGVQAQKTAENLTAGWMLSRLRTSDSRQFLRRAESCYLAFDARQAREQHLETLGMRPYLIGPDTLPPAPVEEPPTSPPPAPLSRSRPVCPGSPMPPGGCTRTTRWPGMMPPIA